MFPHPLISDHAVLRVCALHFENLHVGKPWQAPINRESRRVACQLLDCGILAGPTAVSTYSARMPLIVDLCFGED